MSARAALPYRLLPTGLTAMASGDDALVQMLMQIVFVEQGERLNRPDFGCQFGGLAFLDGRDAVSTAASALVHSALRQWGVAWIDVVSVDVTMAGGIALVTIVYRDTRSQAVRQVVLRRGDE